jgi:hypothetical protein
LEETPEKQTNEALELSRKLTVTPDTTSQC